MGNRERMILHDKPIAFTMIGVFFLSFFVVLNVIHIRNKQLDAHKQIEKERYATDVVYLYNSMASDEAAEKPDFEHLYVTKGNVFFVFSAMVGNGYSFAPVYMVAVSNEPLAEELKEGRFPTDNEIENGQNCVVIGEGLKRLTEETKEGVTLKIDGVSYDVTGTLKDTTGDGMDNRVLVFQNCLATASVKDFDGSHSYFVKYGSNVEEELQTDGLLEWMHGFLPDSKIEASVEDEIRTMDGTKMLVSIVYQYTQFVMYGLFTLCMIGCLIVSSIWIKRRKKEIMVRKALGSSVINIAGVLLRDLIIMLGIAVVLCFMFLLLQSLYSKENWFCDEYIFHNLGYLIVSILLMVSCSLIRPIYMVYKISPVEGTRE